MLADAGQVDDTRLTAVEARPLPITDPGERDARSRWEVSCQLQKRRARSRTPRHRQDDDHHLDRADWVQAGALLGFIALLHAAAFGIMFGLVGPAGVLPRRFLHECAHLGRHRQGLPVR